MLKKPTTDKTHVKQVQVVMANNTEHTTYMKSRELSSSVEATSILCSDLKQTCH